MKAVERIQKWLAVNGYDGILLSRRDNFAWISGGAKNHVLTTTETGIAYYAIKRDSIDLIADSSDLLRMSEEQNPLNGTPILVPWYESMDTFLARYIGGSSYVSDTGVAGTRQVQDELVDMRLKLTKEELRRYQEIGQQCARIVESVCREARPGQTEIQIANMLKCRCLESGISPGCVLAGADERILNYRHPMPTDKKIENSLMIVLGGEKYGLNISITRMVCFESIPDEIKKRLKSTQYVFAHMQKMMREGMAYADYFAAVQKLYQEAGFPQEWQEHHQGGPTGYACREFVVTPETKGAIHEGQVYAWNPTIAGTKCEDTTILTANGLQNLTQTTEWPRTIIETPDGEFEAADILLRQ